MPLSPAEAEIDRILKLYRQGHFTEAELELRLFERLTIENLEFLLTNVNAEDLNVLKKQAIEAPRSEGEWSQIIIAESWGGPLEREEVRIQRHAEHIERYRRGIETMRAWLER